MQWRDALWGDYEDVKELSTPGTSQEKKRAERRDALRKLFSGSGKFTSYTTDIRPVFYKVEVDEACARDNKDLQELALWEIREVNFRCEVRALDAVIMKHHTMDSILLRDRLVSMSGIWGSINGGDAVIPVWETMRPSTILRYWVPSFTPGWERRRSTLSAFVSFILRWHDVPLLLREKEHLISNCTDKALFNSIEKLAIDFYCKTFVSYFHRMPILPALCPLPLTDD